MNPYEILGVEKDASPDKIKKAYRTLCKEHHPDKGGNADKFKEINSAYETLSDPDKKQKYDTFGDNPNPFGGGFSGFNGFGGFDEVINQFFGGNPMNRQRTRKGADEVVGVKLTLAEIMTGSTKKFSYSRNIHCDGCKGKGGAVVNKCGTCNGTGQTIKTHNTAYGNINTFDKCTNCDNGFIIADKCKKCNGAGTIRTTEEMSVKIPAGVVNGMHIQLRGSGNAMRNGEVGDLMVRVEEIPDPNFQREGNNLIHDIDIPISEAVLGSEKEVKTPVSTFKFKIETGCESGKIYSFNGKGIPNIGQDGRNYGNGNLYVRVTVKIPTNIDGEVKQLFEELKRHNY